MTSNRYQIAVGDSLSSIAHQTLGDYSKWREIANFNNVEDIFAELKTGTSINIPDADELKEILRAEAVNLGKRLLTEAKDDLDLSSLKIGDGTVNPWQIIQWLK